ncbi:MAG: beta-lactamase family protein [Acidobacteria bacterium]|nr:beta-lactamase family protein [Acidobacteriota bacterium]
MKKYFPKFCGPRFTAACGLVLMGLLWAKPCLSQSLAPPRRLFSPASFSRKVDPVVEADLRELHIPGLSIAIMRGHKLVLAKGYGVADHEVGASATAHTIYSIGSVSKQFTAAAIMKLYEEGRLQLDGPVSNYLPEYPAAHIAIPTIRNLLQQNSGLPAWDDLAEFQDFDTGDPRRFDLFKIVDVIARQPPLYRPGEWWSYSNSNYTVLAAVVEHVTGMQHDKYLAGAFFNRLGLRSMGGCAGSGRVASAGRRAVGYQDSRSYALRPVTAMKARAFTGAGGLCSDAVDLAKWMRALANGEVVSAKSFREMTTAVPVRAGFAPPYGFGISLLPLAGQQVVWHMGVLSGYTTVLAYFPEHHLIISILANARRARLDQIVKDVARALLGLQAPRLRDLPIDSREAELVAGSYDDGMFKFRIFRSGTQLFLDVPPAGAPTRLLHQGGRKFATGRPTDFRLRFEPETGKVQRIVWEWAELRAYGRRTP